MATQSAEMPEWMTVRKEPDLIELAPDAAASFGLFAALGTQWRRHALSGARLGIDYAAIQPTAQMLGVVMTPAVLADIRIMESAALDSFAQAERRR